MGLGEHHCEAWLGLSGDVMLFDFLERLYDDSTTAFIDDATATQVHINRLMGHIPRAFWVYGSMSSSAASNLLIETNGLFCFGIAFGTANRGGYNVYYHGEASCIQFGAQDCEAFTTMQRPLVYNLECIRSHHGCICSMPVRTNVFLTDTAYSEYLALVTRSQDSAPARLQG